MLIRSGNNVTTININKVLARKIRLILVPKTRFRDNFHGWLEIGKTIG